MKRLLAYGTLVLLIGFFLIGAVALEWLLESPDGLKWLFRMVSRQGVVTISARGISGGIGTSLRLEGLSVHWKTGDLAVDDLRLRWQPLLVPFGKVSVQELTLQGLLVRDNSPESSTGPELAWPHITGFPTRVDGWIDALSMSDISYIVRDSPPVSISKVSAAVSWRNARLGLSKLDLATGAGRFTGTVTAGFSQPLLLSTLVFEPPQPLADCSRFELRTNFRPGQSPELLVGELKVSALKGKTTRFALTSVAGIAKKELKLRGISLTQPGRRGTVQGDGSFLISGETRLRLRLADLDLSQELREKLALSGNIFVTGTPEDYSGHVELASVGAGWRKVRLTGSFRGDRDEINLSRLDAALLNGSVRGDLLVGWLNGLEVKGALQGRGLDPAQIAAQWSGIVNFDVNGEVAWDGDHLSHAEARGRLLDSRLRGKALSGEISASLQGENLQIKRLFLTGKGFDIHADGQLTQRLNVSARISDLSGLVPQTGGSLELLGWGRYAGGKLQAVFSGQGHDLAADGVRVGSAGLNVRLDGRSDHNSAVTAELSRVTYHGFQAATASLSIAGTLSNHQMSLALRSAGAELKGSVSGGYAQEVWKGELVRLAGRDPVGPWQLSAPALLIISSQALSIAPLVITGSPSERLELSGQLLLQPLRGTARASWSGIDLARSGQWLTDIHLVGRSSGRLQLESATGERVHMTGQASASGTASMGEQTVTIRKAALDFTAGDRGINAALDFRTAEGISLSGRFTSPDPATLAVPSHGELFAEWKGVDPVLAQRWLPQGVSLYGHLSGDISGKLLPEQRLDLSGTVNVEDGGGRWRGEGREFSAALKKAVLSWNWRANSLNGTFAMSLSELGEARGQFQLPLAARLGAALDPAGPVKGAIIASFHEKGLLTSVFPGLLQESKGELALDLKVGGLWKSPTVTGTLGLDKSGAYLPTTGIRLKDVRLAARLEGNQVRIDSFQMVSGSGSLMGNANLTFDGIKLTGYKGLLRGKNFQAIYLPELQLVVDPELTFEGNLEKLTARGVILVPELLINPRKSAEVVKSSQDVVIAGKDTTRHKQTGMALDLQAKVILGDRVFVKAEGLDARLEGEVHLTVRNYDDITARGELRVAKGNYYIYGVTLGIERGRALFGGGVVERPILDILALRKVDDVKAGVTITGTLESPLIKLYSDPNLPEVEIMSYIILGRKLREQGDQIALLTKAAALMVSSKQSTPLDEKVKQLLGLDTFGFTSGKEPVTGYKAIESSLNRGSQASANSNGFSQSIIQVGKYLTPKLYISYGRSLFNEEQQVRARYSITKRWEVESRISSGASGGDVYYRIEFE